MADKKDKDFRTTLRCSLALVERLDALLGTIKRHERPPREDAIGVAMELALSAAVIADFKAALKAKGIANGAKKNAKSIPIVDYAIQQHSTFGALPHGVPSGTFTESTQGVVRSWFDVFRRTLEGPDSTGKELLKVSLRAARELLGEPEAIGDAPPGSQEQTEAEAKAKALAGHEHGRDLIDKSQGDVLGDPESREGLG